MNKELTVLEAKRYGIYSCAEDTTLLDVARRMVEEDISCLVVVDPAGYLSGVITHTDLVQAMLEEEEWPGKPVKRHMSEQVITISPVATLEEAGRLLLENCVHRIVVVEREEGDREVPVAVVASSDLIYHMVKGEGAEADEIRSP